VCLRFVSRITRYFYSISLRLIEVAVIWYLRSRFVKKTSFSSGGHPFDSPSPRTAGGQETVTNVVAVYVLVFCLCTSGFPVTENWSVYVTLKQQALNGTLRDDPCDAYEIVRAVERLGANLKLLRNSGLPSHCARWTAVTGYTSRTIIIIIIIIIILLAFTTHLWV
jgi:hypothetical protein